MINYDGYFDKVYGCLLGKCIAGNIGAPYRGIKDKLNLKYDRTMISSPLYNYEFDLQILWLKVLEEKGVAITSCDLAAALSDYNVLWQGEYAYFKKNKDRGLKPPYTALFENEFYNEGSGCAVRGEIWGLICPTNPELAVKLSEKDGILDHDGEAVCFERFISALIALSFCETDLERLVKCASTYLGKSGDAHRVIKDALYLYKKNKSVDYARDYFMSEYGSSAYSNSFFNIGITVFCLLNGNGNFINTIMNVLNCGFDTCCTAGIIGSVLGAMQGAKLIIDIFGFKDNGYKSLLKYTRKSNRIEDLANDVCKVGLHFMNNHPLVVRFVERNGYLPFSERITDMRVSVDYPQGVFFTPGRAVKVMLSVESDEEIKNCRLTLQCPENFTYFAEEKTEKGGLLKTFTLQIKYNGKTEICEKNIFKAIVTANGKTTTEEFGLVGRTPYTVYGPFWENKTKITVAKGENTYTEQFKADSPDLGLDNLRFYQLNTVSDIEKDYLSGKECGGEYSKEGRTIYADGDEIDFSKLITYKGDCVAYFTKTLLFSQDTTVNIQVGANSPFKLYVNGEYVAHMDGWEHYTPETRHLLGVKMKEGLNTITVKLRRTNADCKFTLNLLEPRDKYPPHIVGLKYKI